MKIGKFKALTLMSVVVSAVLVSGCGDTKKITDDTDSPIVDTTAPIITNTSYTFTLEENNVSTIPLMSDDSSAAFSENSDKAIINGTNLEFTAPAYVDGDTNSYIVSVTATDGTNSSSKNFTFTVTKEVVVDNYDANASYVAITGDKTFTNDGGNLRGPSGLLWKNEGTEVMTYTEAQAHCSNSWRVPKKNELLNLLNYDKGSAANDASLIDDDFNEVINANLSEAWVLGGYTVNYFAGTASQGISNDEHSVLCVSGTSADVAPNLSNSDPVQDSRTNLEWKIVGPQSGKTVADATTECASFGRLPTINELRSVIGSNNKIEYIVAPDFNLSLWSSTEFKNDASAITKYYRVNFGSGTNLITADDDNQTHRVTCVRDF